MIVVDINFIPGGQREGAVSGQKLGRLTIVNDLSAEERPKFGNYEITLQEGGKKTLGRVENFRRFRGATELVGEALKAVGKVEVAPMKSVTEYVRCDQCDQPMLPPGEVKKPGEYDHASGCPAAKQVTEEVAP